MEINEWRKAARSMNNGNCVEVADSILGVLIRDSKDPRLILTVNRDAWARFLNRVRMEE